MKENDLVSKAIIQLFEKERFYGELIIQMHRIISNSVPTAGVCVKDTPELHINIDWFASKSNKEQVAVLIHECKHLLLDHIGRAKILAPDVYGKSANKDIVDSLISGAKHRLINIAADCSINPGIPNIPKEGCFPAIFNLPNDQLMEWYVEQLKNNDKCKDMTEFDDHSLWSESEDDQELLKSKIRLTVNKAAENARAAGKMTADNELLVERLNRVDKNWKQELRRFAAHAMGIRVSSTRKRRSRRYGILYPGKTKREDLYIGVAMDTSGSVSNKALLQFMTEIAAMSKYAKIKVVEADSEVKNAYLFDPKKKYTVKGRGGTAYQPAFDYFSKEKGLDGVIYFGDMDCFDEKLIKPTYPVLWAIVGDQKPPASWGSSITIKIEER